MPSDLSKTSDDLRQHYKAVVMQQGRVLLDRDFNALQEIINGRIAADALDEIGPCGTPDDGFAISLLPVGWSGPSGWSYSAPNPLDFLISPGTMYVGGQRFVLPVPDTGQPPWSYFHQPDWINPDDPAAFGDNFGGLVMLIPFCIFVLVQFILTGRTHFSAEHATAAEERATSPAAIEQKAEREGIV